MLRRFTAPATSRATVATRKYTDFHHRTYPTLPIITVFVPIVTVITWFAFICWGSVVYESNRLYKKNLLRSWKRRMGKGYKWSDEIGPEVKTFFKNLPTEAV